MTERALYPCGRISRRRFIHQAGGAVLPRAGLFRPVPGGVIFGVDRDVSLDLVGWGGSVAVSLLPSLRPDLAGLEEVDPHIARYSDALEHLNTLGAADSRDGELQGLSGQCQEALGHYEEARERYARAVARPPVPQEKHGLHDEARECRPRRAEPIVAEPEAARLPHGDDQHQHEHAVQHRAPADRAQRI